MTNTAEKIQFAIDRDIYAKREDILWEMHGLVQYTEDASGCIHTETKNYDLAFDLRERGYDVENGEVANLYQEYVDMLQRHTNRVNIDRIEVAVKAYVSDWMDIKDASDITDDQLCGVIGDLEETGLVDLEKEDVFAWIEALRIGSQRDKETPPDPDRSQLGKAVMIAGIQEPQQEKNNE